jgi:hypothetical protein
MTALLFYLSAIAMGVRSVLWVRVVDKDPNLARIANRDGGRLLLNAVVVLTALLIATGVSFRVTWHGYNPWSSHSVILKLAGIAAFTAIAWTASLIGSFTAIGPARFEVLDWGSLPVFYCVVVMPFEPVKPLCLATAAIAMLATAIYVAATRGVISGSGTENGPRRSVTQGLLIALTSSASAAIFIVLTSSLDAELGGPMDLSAPRLVVLPIRLAVTLLLFAILCGKYRAPLQALAQIGWLAWLKLLVFGGAYLLPLLVCFARLSRENSPKLANALCMVAVSALVFDAATAQASRRIRAGEWLAFALFGLSIAVSSQGSETTTPPKGATSAGSALVSDGDVLSAR